MSSGVDTFASSRCSEITVPMLSRDFPSFNKSPFQHAFMSHNNIGIPSREEELPMDDDHNNNNMRDSFSMFGRASSPSQDGVPKKSSNALATTLSSCQIPGSNLAGGTSLLVASVLGKNLMKPKQAIRGSVKRKSIKDSNDNSDGIPKMIPDAKPRAATLSLLPPPRSMSINGPHINLSSPFVGASMTYLFDKVASATDCRSTGHFVLPKRKVEEHFPPIHKPQGVWMKLLDNKGKEWSFEFCFWHSKDSRIYYFKKFYPFVQSENLSGGDTVFFSRLEPEGTLYMSVKDRVQKSPQQPKQSKQSKASAGRASKDRFKEREHANGGLRYLANDWSPSPDDDYGPRQGKTATMSVDKARASDRGTQCKRRRKNEFPRMSHSQRSSIMDYFVADEVPTQKRRSISSSPEELQHVDRIGGVLGSKRKRLQINVEEYSEWKEIQDLLQPAPGVVPTVVTIDGCDFEEYEEPPVLPKEPSYSPHKSFGPEYRWVKCNDCGRWRRVPSNAFVVPRRWVCTDNEHDPKRAHCGAPQELSNYEVHQLLGMSSDAEDDEVPEERYDLNEGDEEDCGYSQPALWSVTRTLMDKFQKPDSADTCKSYTSEIENLNSAPGNHALQSSSCEEEINEEESTPPFIERSEFLVSGARKDTSMPTDCYDFLGLAAVEKKYVDLSTTETKGGQFFGLADKVEPKNW